MKCLMVIILFIAISAMFMVSCTQDNYAEEKKLIYIHNRSYGVLSINADN